jgi:hypothetical protein
MRAEALLLLTLAVAIGVSAGELCRQEDAVKIVIVDFWERPVEFRYYVRIGHSFWAGRGLELNLRGTYEWLVVSIPRQIQEGGVYMELAWWREVAVVFIDGKICVSGFDDYRVENGTLKVILHRDGATYREAVAAGAAVAALTAAMYLAERRLVKHRSWPKIAAMRWLIAVSLVIAFVNVILHAADVHRPEGLNLVGLDRGTDRTYMPQRMRVEVVDFWGRVVEVPLAVRDDYVAFGLGSVEVTIPPRSYNVFSLYLWRLDGSVAYATVWMKPGGGVFVHIGGGMRGEYELHGDVLIVRLYKDGLTYKHVLLIAAVVIVVVTTTIGLWEMRRRRRSTRRARSLRTATPPPQKASPQ